MAGFKILVGSTAMATLLLLPQVSSAQVGAEDGVAYKAVQNKDWTSAEQQLLAGLQKNPDNVFRQLNLAWVYAQTGRKDDAAAIYKKILSGRENRVAALPSGAGMPVKALAERGLTLLEKQ